MSENALVTLVRASSSTVDSYEENVLLFNEVWPAIRATPTDEKASCTLDSTVDRYPPAVCGHTPSSTRASSTVPTPISTAHPRFRTTRRIPVLRPNTHGQDRDTVSGALTRVDISGEQ